MGQADCFHGWSYGPTVSAMRLLKCLQPGIYPTERSRCVQSLIILFVTDEVLLVFSGCKQCSSVPIYGDLNYYLLLSIFLRKNKIWRFYLQRWMLYLWWRREPGSRSSKFYPFFPYVGWLAVTIARCPIPSLPVEMSSPEAPDRSLFAGWAYGLAQAGSFCLLFLLFHREKDPNVPTKELQTILPDAHQEKQPNQPTGVSAPRQQFPVLELHRRGLAGSDHYRRERSTLVVSKEKKVWHFISVFSAVPSVGVGWSLYKKK
ncbi:hypothetical protein B0T19DRAFT_201858 [Cercophora scortea]|uniref:Uncharacterized protein n=1 Tax=Cercophora scortea TaxID=314031 RepID=A0AAE0M903_9PEZI|nr:hypothetical protein B0T19DRAFT_201858 [Cercophora scortea]